MRSKIFGNGCQVTLLVWATLLLLGIVAKFYFEHQEHVRDKANKEVVMQSLLSTSAFLDSLDTRGVTKLSPRHIREQIINHLKKATVKGFWVCKSENLDEPLVVYEGPLTPGFVQVLCGNGFLTQWSVNQWKVDPLQKTATLVHP